MDPRFFFSIFTLIFIAELPDKTAFASLLLATRHKPLAVFLGAAAAFVIQSMVSVLFGSVIGKFSPSIIHRGAGVLFLVFAVTMALRKADTADQVSREAAPLQFWKDAGTAFTAIFIAEWGDLTQLATATLAAKYHRPWTIFFAATLALWTVTGIGVTLGHYSRKSLNPRYLKWVAVAAFAAVGVWLIVEP